MRTPDFGVCSGLPLHVSIYHTNNMKKGLRKILPTDNRFKLIAKFDESIDEFFVRTKSFHEDMVCIADSDEDKRKIHVLSLNLLNDLNFIVNNAKMYENEIRWSMLDIRLEKNEEYKNKMENDLIEFRRKMNDIINNGGIDVYDRNTECLNEEDSESKAIVLSATDSIAMQLSNMGDMIFRQIMQKVQYLDKMFTELISLHVSRTDDDYMKMYNRMREKYESTEEFKAFKENYIQTTIEFHFAGKLSNPSQIDAIIQSRNIDAMNDSDVGMIWSSSSNSPAMVARLFAKKNLKHDREIQKFFRYRSEIDLLEDFRIEANKNIFRIGKGSVVSNELVFIAPYSEIRLEKAWNEIHKIMDDAVVKDWEWCVLHHALSLKHKINNVDFWTFSKWIKNHFNEEIITSSNYKNYRYNYFVATYLEEWNIQNYKEYYISRKDPKQRGKQFSSQHERQYYRIVDDLYRPLLKALSK